MSGLSTVAISIATTLVTKYLLYKIAVIHVCRHVCSVESFP